MCYKLAPIAANWWIEQMKKKCYILLPAKVCRDKTGFVIINDLLAEEFSRFQEILIEQIYSTIESKHYLNLFCYYYPCKELSSLAKQANISTAYFPIKAQLIIEDACIRVSTNLEDFHTLHLSTDDL